MFHFTNVCLKSRISIAHFHWPSQHWNKESGEFMIEYHIHVALNHGTITIINDIGIVKKPDQFMFHYQSHIVSYIRNEKASLWFTTFPL